MNGTNQEQRREDRSREETGGESSRGKNAAASESEQEKTGDPGRTPGSAEGVEDFEKTGNE